MSARIIERAPLAVSSCARPVDTTGKGSIYIHTKPHHTHRAMKDDSNPEAYGGLPALKGYDYQKEATVWLALEMIFLHGASDVVIEPAPHADLEATLPEDASSAIRYGPTRLLIQIKYLSSAWTLQALREIVQANSKPSASRGPKRAPAPVEQLAEDPSLRYALITNGQLAQGAATRQFVINNWDDFPRKVQEANLVVPAGTEAGEIASRVGVLELLTRGDLLNRIRRLLSDPKVDLHLPLTRFDEAMECLKEQVHDRLIGDQPLRWSREDIVEQLRKFGGAPLRTADMEAFEPPRGYDKLVQRLDKDNRLLLLGPPGSGKTLIADMLAHGLRVTEPPFEVISVESPTEIHQHLLRPGPFLFRVEDPWGQDARAPERGWAAQLPKLFRQVSGPRGAAHKILVTTRKLLLSDVYGQSIPKEMDQASASITYDDYDRTARARILTRKTKSLGEPSRRRFIHENREAIIRRLEVPLSIDRFISAVRFAPAELPLDLEKLLSDAEVDELSGTLEREILGLDWAYLPAIFMWTQLCVVPTCDIDTVRRRARLLKQQPSKPFRIQQFIDRMVKAGWFKREGARIHAHPTTVTGLMRLLGTLPDEAENLLNDLLEHLCSTEGAQTAYEIADLIPESRRPCVPTEVTELVRQHLLGKLLHAGANDFAAAMEAAHRWLPGDSPVALLVGALIHPPDRQEIDWWPSTWSAPDWPPETYAAIQASHAAQVLLGKYIRVWPTATTFERQGSGFAEWTLRFNWDLSAAYLETLEETLGFASDIDELVRGALSGKTPPYDELLNRILAAPEKIDKNDPETDLQWQASQGMLDDAYSDYLLDIDDVAYEAAGISSALDELVRVRREREGYAWILSHPQKRRLHQSWGKAIEHGAPPVTDEEFRTFVTSEVDASPVQPWNIIAEQGLTQFSALIVEALGTAASANLSSALNALIKLLPPQDFGPTIRDASRNWTEKRQALVLLAAHQLVGAEKSVYLDMIIAAIGAPLSRLIEICASALAETANPVLAAQLTTEDRRRLREWAQEHEEELGQASLNILAATGESVLEEAQHAITSGRLNARQIALQALSYEHSPGARHQLNLALSDDEARVRAAAVKALAAKASPEEQSTILRCIHDPSYFVRAACVEVIRREKWETGHSALLELLSDSHDSGPGSENHINHWIACNAAKALQEWLPYPIDLFAPLLGFVARGLEANTDPVVHETVLRILIDQNIPGFYSTLIATLDQLAGSAHSSALPLRRNILSAIMHRLYRWPLRSEPFTLEPVAREAKRTSFASAGFAMLVLGMAGPRAHADIAHVLTIERNRRERSLLALIGAAATKVAPCEAAKHVLANEQEFMQVAAWVHEGPEITAETWIERWHIHSTIHNWLSEFQEEKAGWPHFIFASLKYFLGTEFCKSLATNL